MAKRKRNMQTPSDAKFQVIGLWGSMDTTEDLYEEGLVGGPDDQENVWFETNLGLHPDLKSLIDSVAEATGASPDPKHWEATDDGRISTAFMVDENSTEPSARQIEAWKKGKERLWSADVHIGVAFGNLWQPDVDTLNGMTVLSDKKASNPGQPPKLKSKLLR